MERYYLPEPSLPPPGAEWSGRYRDPPGAMPPGSRYYLPQGYRGPHIQPQASHMSRYNPPGGSPNSGFLTVKARVRRLCSHKRLIFCFLLFFLVFFLILQFSSLSGHEGQIWEERRARMRSRYNELLLQKFGKKEMAEIDVKISSKRARTDASVIGSNMDHNNSITNPCLTQRPLLGRTILEPSARPFQTFGFRSFVLKSAYRVDARSFVVIGLSLLSSHDKRKGAHAYSEHAKRCAWIGSPAEGAERGGDIPGRSYLVWPREHHHLTYETLMWRCELQEKTAEGVGGTLMLTIDGTMHAVYHEPRGLVHVAPSEPFKHEIAFCSFPLYRDLVPARLAEWLQYTHRILNVDYFILNDGGSVNEDMMKVLQPYVRKGLMEINDIRWQFYYETKQNVLTLNDCLFKTRYIARWTLMIDFDEYLYVAPPQTLKSLLKSHDSAAYLTFGSMWWSTNLCRPPKDKKQWPLERMSFHWPVHYCVGKERGYTNNMCLNYWGHRKYIVNPRKTTAVEVHRVVEPLFGGVDLNTTSMWNNHFQGILRPSLPVCTEIVREGTYPDWWKESNYLSMLARLARFKGPP